MIKNIPKAEKGVEIVYGFWRKIMLNCVRIYGSRGFGSLSFLSDYGTVYVVTCFWTMKVEMSAVKGVFVTSVH